MDVKLLLGNSFYSQCSIFFPKKIFIYGSMMRSRGIQNVEGERPRSNWSVKMTNLFSHYSFMLHLPLIEFAWYLKRNLIKTLFHPSLPWESAISLTKYHHPKKKKKVILNETQMLLTDTGQWVLDWKSAWSRVLRQPAIREVNGAALRVVLDETRSKSACILAQAEEDRKESILTFHVPFI